eukprot:TRINITY_DN3729_c0_g2_i1.p1 TRINITY_DN3729_c0_g2~~TRINITY_DN3729_c0_g2_i1.p1  ORF type:complete len:639 (-),score=128.12 TRINITY_DN3729_c0_g2_i1:147-2063(-)
MVYPIVFHEKLNKNSVTKQINREMSSTENLGHPLPPTVSNDISTTVQSSTGEATDVGSREKNSTSPHLNLANLNDTHQDGKVEVDPYQVKIPHVLSQSVHEDEENKMRRETVKEAFRFAYTGYKEKCLGQGELRPGTGTCHNWMGADLGLTLIDSLDTMLIMGFDDLYKESRDWIQTNLGFDKDISVSVFEITIRCLGGLLSAYHLTKDELLLDKARDLADRLLPAFETSTNLPMSIINLRTGKQSLHGWAGGYVILSEIASIQLEFSFLSHLTGNKIYAEKALRVYRELYKYMPSDYLPPVRISPYTFRTYGVISAGSLGDSYYEYLLKYWLITNKTIPKLGEWYYLSATSILSSLGRWMNDRFLAITEKSRGHNTKGMDHLTCFIGAMFALGTEHSKSNSEKAKYMTAAEGIASLCKEMYNIHETGLHGEFFHVHESRLIGVDHRFLLRPEAVETWFYLYRLTNNTKYRQWGWEYMQALNKYSRQKYGYSGLRDANMVKRPMMDDIQQSWFLAETLKYLYLLFSSHDVLPLDKFVFNTEAHPFPVFDPSTSHHVNPFLFSEESEFFWNPAFLFPFFPPLTLLIFVPCLLLCDVGGGNWADGSGDDYERRPEYFIDGRRRYKTKKKKGRRRKLVFPV